MEKLKSFRITALHMEGFKSYSQPTDLSFGDPTVITGGNGRGKSSIADAIASLLPVCPFSESTALTGSTMRIIRICLSACGLWTKTERSMSCPAPVRATV